MVFLDRSAEVAATLETECSMANALALTQASQLSSTQRSNERARTREVILTIDQSDMLQYIQRADPGPLAARHFSLVCDALSIIIIVLISMNDHTTARYPGFEYFLT
jgi:hypothetical protein